VRARRNSDVTTTPVLLVWGLGYVLVGVAIATAMAWPVYESWRVLLIAAVSFTIAAVIVLVVRNRRLPGWIIAIAGVLAFVIAVVPLAVPVAMGTVSQLTRGLRDGVAGIIVGWKQLLTLGLPLGEYQAVLVPFFVTMLLGSLLAMVFVTDSRKRSAFAAPVVVAMGTFGILFGSSATGAPLDLGFVSIPAPREVLLGTGLLAVTFIWLLGRTRIMRAQALRIARAKTGTVRQRRESFALAARRNVLALILIALALGAGVVVTPAASALGQRQALRDYVDPAIVVRDQPSPLSSYRAWFETANYDSPLFTVSGDTSRVDRVRLATLDSYDGETFHVSGAKGEEQSSFRRLPRTQPLTSGSAELTITINNGYTGVWVPVPNGLDAAPTFHGARAEQLADGFYINENSSTAIDVVAQSDGAVGVHEGDSYTVFAGDADSSAKIGNETGGATLLEDSLYPTLIDWVKLQKQPRTGEGLTELITRLRARGYLSHSTLDPEVDARSQKWVAALSGNQYQFTSSYSGHSRARVEDLFSQLVSLERKAGAEAVSTQLVAAIGDDEQFATAAALLARYYGFDSRVVIGTRLVNADPAIPIPACGASCTGGNLSAWIEVRNRAGQWVTIDTSPQVQVPPTVVSEGIELPKNPTVPDESNSSVIEPPDVTRNDSQATEAQEQDGQAWLLTLLPILRVVGLSLLGLALLLLPAIVLAVAKSSRSNHRRSARVPEVSAVGAWDELVDLYVDHGIPMPKAATRLELAEATYRQGAIDLAVLVDRAVFAEHPPGRDVSTASWELLDAERAELEAEFSTTQRIRARLTFASFMRQVDPGSAIAALISMFSRKEEIR
jgi:hypothetical protein